MPDDRTMYKVPVTFIVLGPPEGEKNVEKTVQHYLQDFVPDEGPDEPIHILDFSISRPVHTHQYDTLLHAFKQQREEAKKSGGKAPVRE